MRKIIRNPSSEMCPSDFIWIAYVTNATSSSSGQVVTKMIFPAGAKESDVTAVAKKINTNASIVHIVEVSVQG